MLLSSSSSFFYSPPPLWVTPSFILIALFPPPLELHSHLFSLLSFLLSLFISFFLSFFLSFMVDVKICRIRATGLHPGESEDDGSLRGIGFRVRGGDRERLRLRAEWREGRRPGLHDAAASRPGGAPARRRGLPRRRRGSHPQRRRREVYVLVGPRNHLHRRRLSPRLLIC